AILVSGTGRRSANRLVPPPPHQARATPMITTLVRSVALPLAEDSVERWRPYGQFRGPTRTFADMSCHTSVLSPGHHPHPPHVHPQEELLIVLDGEVDIELADSPTDTSSQRLRLKPGMFSYYPATQHHTIHNAGPKPVTYLMFKWHAGPAGVGDPLSTSVFEYDVGGAPAGARPMFQKRLFQQATHCLGKLHAHLTTLQPGAGYDPHVDAYDVAILLLSGEVETLGERVTPIGIIYYSAGELHGMRNVGNVPAVYLVFEFHSPAAVAMKGHGRNRPDHAARKAIHAERYRRKLAKQQRRRGLMGLVRKVAKAIRKLAR
ncbi:MAG: cupin domain-containing protein, partial [Dongiaceae bacterium]